MSDERHWPGTIFYIDDDEVVFADENGALKKVARPRDADGKPGVFVTGVTPSREFLESINPDA
jgi:hypothetical protein